MTKFFKLLTLSLLISPSILTVSAEEQKELYIHRVLVPWTHAKKAKINTNKEDKIKLMELLAKVSKNSGNGKAVKLFEKLASIIRKGKKVTKGGLMWDLKKFAGGSKKQSIRVSEEVYTTLEQAGLIENADRWVKSFRANGDWASLYAFKDWING